MSNSLTHHLSYFIATHRVRIKSLLVAGIVMLTGCAVSGTQVLAPYRLADGTRLQDVVTIGADKTGTAPVVTHVKTFRIGERGGAALVAEGAGSGAGLGTVIVGATVAGVTGGVTGGLIAKAVRHRSNSSSSASCSEPANAQTPTCLCQANPRLPGCEMPFSLLGMEVDPLADHRWETDSPGEIAHCDAGCTAGHGLAGWRAHHARTDSPAV